MRKPLTDKQLENRIRKLYALDMEARVIKAQADAIKAEVKAAIKERYGDADYEHRENGVKIIWKSHPESIFDSKAFCADPDRAELYEKYKRTITKRPFLYDLYVEVRA